MAEEITSIQETISTLDSSGSSSCDCRKKKVDKARDIAIGALILAIIGLLLGLAGLSTAMSANRRVNRLFDTRNNNKEVFLPPISSSQQQQQPRGGDLQMQPQDRL